MFRIYFLFSLSLFPSVIVVVVVSSIYNSVSNVVLKIENTSDRFNGADDVQDNAVMGLAYSTFQRILDNSMQILNPIDRLYSMQNYYFRCNSNRQRNDMDDNDGI